MTIDEALKIPAELERFREREPHVQNLIDVTRGDDDIAKRGASYLGDVDMAASIVANFDLARAHPAC
jgi:hypothetical protein